MQSFYRMMVQAVAGGLLAASCMAVSADGPSTESGFLTDYSTLTATNETGREGVYVYRAADSEKRLSGIRAIMIDQPVLAIAADSKVKSLKPDDAKLVADTFRQVMVDELSHDSLITDRPGEGVVLIRTSLSNLYLQKKKRGLLGYTPAGFVITSAKRALDDVMGKINLTEVVLEAEVVDVNTGDVLVAVQDPHGNKENKKEFASWDEVQSTLEIYAKRLNCRIANARAATTAAQDCSAITAPAAE